MILKQVTLVAGLYAVVVKADHTMKTREKLFHDVP